MQHEIGSRHSLPTARDTDPFNLILGFTKARRIDHIDRYTIDLYGSFDPVTGRSRYRRHDRNIGTGQCIE